MALLRGVPGLSDAQPAAPRSRLDSPAADAYAPQVPSRHSTSEEPRKQGPETWLLSPGPVAELSKSRRPKASKRSKEEANRLAQQRYRDRAKAKRQVLADENEALKAQISDLEAKLDGGLVAENVHLKVVVERLQGEGRVAPPAPEIRADASLEEQNAALEEALSVSNDKVSILYDYVCHMKQATAHMRAAYAGPAEECAALRGDAAK